MDNRVISLVNERATLNLGKCLAQFCKNAIIIHIYGELGIGKTTLVRGFLQTLGYKGNIKSPTYTLVESYNFNKIKVHHFDLYRIKKPEELEFIGIRDFFSKNVVCLFEWPQKGIGILPHPDIKIHMVYENKEKERKAYITAISLLGNSFLESISN